MNELSRKIKFIAYIYICFDLNLDENSYISAKIEAKKTFTYSFSANSKSDNYVITWPTSSQIVESHALF